MAERPGPPLEDTSTGSALDSVVARLLRNGQTEAAKALISVIEAANSSMPISSELAGPQGLLWRGAWSSSASYALDDAVYYAGRAFIALRGSTGSAPPTSAASSVDWDLLVDRGAAGPAGTGSAGVISPSDLSLKAWVIDPAILVTGNRTTPVAGQMIGSLINLPADTVTGVSFFVGVAGATVSNCYVALIDAVTGNRLAVTADLSTVVTSSGLKRAAFTTPTAVAGGPAYVVILVGSATTMPQVSKFPNADTAALNVRGPSSPTGRIRAGQITVASGLTSIPATNDMSGSSAQNTGLWAAID